MTRRSYVQIDGILYEKGTEPLPDVPHIIPDIEPFRDTTGTFIAGRRAWREHLRSGGMQEMGHSDARAFEAAHAKRRAQHAERMARSQAAVAAAPQTDVVEGRRDRPRIAAEVLNRLHGRPTPDRKTLIKIALEEAHRRR